MSMTNEEAIDILKELWCFEKSERYSDKQIREALNMAIESIKTETKKCPICGSDLYEYCFSCCYEGGKVMRNEKKV